LLAWSLRRQLIFVVVISLLPILGILLYTNFELKKNDVAEANASTLRLVQNIAQQHQQNVENTRQFLESLSRLPEVQGGNIAACNKVFRDLQAANPLYANIFLTSPGGVSRPACLIILRFVKAYAPLLKTPREIMKDTLSRVQEAAHP
jgi:hypothetical protein